MHWIEPYQYQHRYGHDTSVATENEKKALEAVIKKLGGTIKSTRKLHESNTGASGFSICEALVELP
jgi:hypothetical protein